MQSSVFLAYLFMQILFHSSLSQDQSEPKTIPDRADHIAQLRSQLEASEMVAQIHGSLQQLSETARLRQQLQDAIEQDVYARPAEPVFSLPDATTAAVTDDPFDPPITQPPRFDLIRFLLGQARDLADAELPLGVPLQQDDGMLGAANPSDTDDQLREFIRSTLAVAINNTLPGDADVLGGLQPDIIDSALVGDLFDDSAAAATAAAAVSKNQLRESLELVSVTEDTNFTLGGNVNTWHVLQHRAAGVASGVHALVGITYDASVMLVLEQNGTYQSVQQIELVGPVSASLTFVQWTADHQMDGYVVVAVPGELLFVRVRNDLSEMHVAWRWSLLPRVTALLHFQVDGSDRLLVATAIDAPADAPANLTAVYAADIYRFDARAQYTWLTQKIALAAELRAVQFIELGREFVLVLAQTDAVELMRCGRGGSDTQPGRFSHLKSIEAPQVGEAIVAFQIGGLTYIAVGGVRPQILRYHRTEFIAQTVLSSSWGRVERVVAIPARTYRDDLIVLVQHRLPIQGGHSGPVLEALIWTGLAFQTAAVAVPCFLNGVQWRTGIACMLDEDRDAGIAGASVIQRGTEISLLVPRQQAPSGLFKLAFRLDAVLNPTVGQAATQYSHGDLLERLNAQTDMIAEAETAVLNGVDGDREVTGDWWVAEMLVGELSVDEAAQSLEYGEMRFGEVPWTPEDAEVDVSGMLDELETLQRMLEELEGQMDTPEVSVASGGNGQFQLAGLRVLPREKRESGQEASAQNVHVKHLQVDYINDVPVKDFVFLAGDRSLDLGESDVYLESDDVHVSDEVQLSPIVGDSIGQFNGANVHIAGDVIIGEINGLPFNELMRNVVMVNVDNALDELEVTGNVIFRDNLRINQLNELAFPDDFLWSQADSDEEILITGQKEFTHRVGTIDIDIDGLHNGVDTANCVTLSTEQTLLGHITFADLQVTEVLNVTGKIVAPNIQHQLANPSLLQTQYVRTDCQFAQLIVNGPVFVHGSLHGVDLDAMLADVVYKSSPATQIAAFKTFDQLNVGEVQLTSGILNSIPVDQFMTLDTEQTLQVNAMSGNVIFRDLRIDGLIDFVNVTELDENAIRLSGDQYTEVELIFDQNAFDDIDVQAENINILRTLNGIDLQTLVPLDGPITIAGNVEIDALLATNLDVGNNPVIAMGVLNGLDLLQLDTVRLSRSRSQPILAPYFIRNLRVVGDLQADSVNGLPIADVQRHLQAMATQTVSEFLGNAETRLQRLSVDGNVQLQRVNGHDFSVIMNNAVWLDRENQIETVLTFERPVEVQGPLRTVNVNELNFDDFVAGMVRSDRLENLQFHAVQTFARAPIGVQTVNARQLGAIEAAAILSVRTTSVNNLTVLGNMKIDRLSVAGTLSGTDLTELSTNYVFDELNGAHVLRHPNVRFGPGVSVESLWMHQVSPNVTAFLESLVPKDGNIVITGRKTFAGRVSFDHDLQVNVLNSIGNLPALMDAMVFNEPNTTVRLPGDVRFTDPVSASRLTVDGDITTNVIMDCDWTEWLRNGVRTDLPWTRTEPLHFVGQQSVLAENIQATLANGIAVERMITLHTEQSFNGTTRFGTVVTSGNVPVDGLVNGVDLRREYANTLMISGDQVISTPINFQSIRVMQSLQTVGPINGGLDLTQIVMLDEDITLTGSFSFDSIVANALQTGDQLVSGIDFTRWTHNTLLKSSNSTQTVTGNWTIGELDAANIDGSGRMNGHHIEQLAQRISVQGSGDMVGTTADAQQGVNRVCKQMRALVERSQQFKYALGHFEELLRIASAEEAVNLVHVFAWNAADFMLLNAGCVTRVFKWAPTSGTFKPVGELNTGSVVKWLMLSNGSQELHWATNSGPNVANCSSDGLNVWQFRAGEMELVRKLGVAGEFVMNQRFQATADAFYALQSISNKVFEFDWLGNQLDEWKLPDEAMASDGQQRSAFVFLPGQINFGLALSDGARLSRLTSTSNVTKPRSKRFFDKPLFEQWQPLGAKRVGATKRERMESTVHPLWSGFGAGVNKSAAVPEMKLKMFKEDAKLLPWPCNITWPKCKLGWWPKRDAKQPEFELEDIGGADDTLGMVHIDDLEADGKPQDKLVDRMQKADDNPEEVVMAMPPILLDDENDGSRTSTTEPQIGSPKSEMIENIKQKAEQLEDKVKDEFNDAKKSSGDALQNVGHKTKKLADNVVNQLSVHEPTKNLTSRIGKIEDKAKQWADKVMDRLSSRSNHSESFERNADSSSEEKDDLQAGMSSNFTTTPPTTITTSSVNMNTTSKNEIITSTEMQQEIVTVSPLIDTSQDDHQVGTTSNVTTKAPSSATSLNTSTQRSVTSTSSIGIIPTTENPQESTTISPKNNTSLPRIDTFGRIEANSKVLADRIMDAQIGPPKNQNSGSFDDDDHDSELAATPSELDKDETTQSPTTDPLSSTANDVNSSVLRVDAFGRIEAQSKVLADRIMDAQIGPPGEPNNMDDEEDDDDDDLSSTGSQLGSTLFSEPHVRQEMKTTVQLQSNQTTSDNASNQSASSDPQVGGIFDVMRNVGFATRLGHEIVEELREDYRQSHRNDSDDRSKQHHNAGHEVHQPERIADQADDEADEDADVGIAAAAQTTTIDPHEPSIGRAVPTIGGVATTENQYLPGRRLGSELVALDVGTTYRRLLVAVSEWTAETVKGHEDRIRIYEDIVDGRVFQTIACHRPHSLTALRLGIDAALVFVEREAELRVFVYRGIEGFVPFAAFTMPAPVRRLQVAQLPAPQAAACWRTVLAVQMVHEVRLLEAMGTGYCGMSAEALECE